MPRRATRECFPFATRVVGIAGIVLLCLSFVRTPVVAHRTRSPDEHSRWAMLRSTSCDGFAIPRAASIGSFGGRQVPLLRTLTHRDGLASLANQLNLTRRAAELGVFRGEFSEKNLLSWKGNEYVMVDMWTPTDCVGGNMSACTYPNESRAYDFDVTRFRMTRAGQRFAGRYRILRASTRDAAEHFVDGYFDWIYLDATHTYAEARDDLALWYPKVRRGGLVSGHDYQFQHQELGEGYTFGVSTLLPSPRPQSATDRRHLHFPLISGGGARAPASPIAVPCQARRAARGAASLSNPQKTHA